MTLSSAATSLQAKVRNCLYAKAFYREHTRIQDRHPAHPSDYRRRGVIDCLIPYAMEAINQIKAGCEFEVLLKYGGILLASVRFAFLRGRRRLTAAITRLRNLRRDIYYRVQTFTFENIDRFSASSLSPA